MAEKTPPSYWEDLEPRFENVKVGSLDMVIEELTLDRWEELMKALAVVIDGESVIKPLGELFRGYLARAASAEKDADAFMSIFTEDSDTVAALVKKVMEQFMARDLPAIAVIALRNEKNVKRMVAEEKITLGNGDDGMVELEAIVRKHATIRQLPALIEKAIEVNDPSDVLGKFRGVFERLREAVGIKAEETPEPEKAEENLDEVASGLPH